MFILILKPVAETAPLRIGVLPVVESLPFLVAEEKGLFQSWGITIEILTFASALERDSAIQAGVIHGAIHDILGLSLLKSKDIPYRILTNIALPTSKMDLFALLRSPESSLKSIEELRGGEVGLSSHTIVEYVIDSLLNRRGIRVDEVKKVEVKKIPLRYQMLMEGKLKTAILPEPLASLAIFQGAKKLAGDYGLKGTQVILVFQDSILQSERETLVRLRRAYGQSIRMINEDPQRWRDLLVQKGRLPPIIKDVYQLNPFSEVSLPDPQDIQAIKTWMEGKGFETSKLSYSSLVSDLWMRSSR